MLIMVKNTKIASAVLLTLLHFSTINQVYGILGGRIPRSENAPAYEALIKRDGKEICAGALISVKHVVTSAHCVYPNRGASEFRIVLGSSSLRGPTTTVGSIKHAPGFDINAGRKYNVVPANDIAVLTLSKAVDCKKNKRIQIIPYQTTHKVLGKDATLSYSGWGANKVDTKDFNDKLKFVYVKLANQGDQNEAIQKLQNTVNTNHHYFIGHRELVNSITSGANYGDLGAPLVYQGHLVGVLSRWSGGFSYLAEIFTQIHPFHTFLNGLIHNDQDTKTPHACDKPSNSTHHRKPHHPDAEHDEHGHPHRNPNDPHDQTGHHTDQHDQTGHHTDHHDQTGHHTDQHDQTGHHTPDQHDTNTDHHPHTTPAPHVQPTPPHVNPVHPVTPSHNVRPHRRN